MMAKSLPRPLAHDLECSLKLLAPRPEVIKANVRLLPRAENVLDGYQTEYKKLQVFHHAILSVLPLSFCSPLFLEAFKIHIETQISPPWEPWDTMTGSCKNLHSAFMLPFLETKAQRHRFNLCLPRCLWYWSQRCRQLVCHFSLFAIPHPLPGLHR